MTYARYELEGRVSREMLDLRSARRAAKLTQDQVAASCGVSPTTYGRAERGVSSLTPEQIKRGREHVERMGVDRLSERMREFRAKWNISLPEAGAMIGVSASSWQSIEYRRKTTRRCLHREKILQLLERWEAAAEAPPGANMGGIGTNWPRKSQRRRAA